MTTKGVQIWEGGVRLQNRPLEWEIQEESRKRGKKKKDSEADERQLHKEGEIHDKGPYPNEGKSWY